MRRRSTPTVIVYFDGSLHCSVIKIIKMLRIHNFSYISSYFKYSQRIVGSIPKFHASSQRNQCSLIRLPQEALKILSKPHFSRFISTSNALFCEAASEEAKPESTINPLLDRSKIITPEESIRYMKSKAYQTTYGDGKVWEIYRRNFKGHYVPRKTRVTCIRGGVISCGNPCPLCRDEYLVLHYTNVDLLKQFIDPYRGTIYDLRRIHICQKKLLQLQVALKLAKRHGLITHEVPFRYYNYEEFYPNWKREEKLLE